MSNVIVARRHTRPRRNVFTFETVKPLMANTRGKSLVLYQKARNLMSTLVVVTMERSARVPLSRKK